MNLSRRTHLAFVAVSICVGPLAAQDSRSALVDQLFARWSSPDTPGAAVAVARGGEVLHVGTYGVRDVDGGDPITRDTVFYIASTSKQFTAACILDLAERGGISLADDVRDYIPELPDYGEKITLRHLLTHRSGLRDFLELMLFAGWELDDQDDPQRALELICRQKRLNFPPGSDFGYSNTGYFLLSEIVRRVSGSSLREYAQEHVFAPLGMNSSVFKDDAEQEVPRLAVGHELARSGYRARHTRFALVGSGGLYSTLDDLLAWQANFSTGAWGEELLREMQTPPTLRPDQGRSPELGRYGYGLMLRDYKGLPVVMHPGGSFGYQANLVRFPEQDLSIVVLANSSDVPAAELGFAIADIYLAGEASTEEAARSGGAGGRPGARIFRSPETGSVLILSTRADGSSRIATLSFKVEVAASAPSEMRSVGSGLPVRVMIREGEGGEPDRLEVGIEDQEVQVFEELGPVSPDPEDRSRKLGEYFSEELGATVSLVERGGQLAIDDSGMSVSIPPFLEISRDTAISDRGLQLDFLRDTAGEVVGMDFSTGRINRLHLTKK